MTAAKLKGRYEKLAVLGQGGMGVVYKAFDSELRREVALKTILDSQNQAALDLFQKECAILAALNHPNIVDIYDIGEFEDGGAKKPYFVMPLLHGVTLDYRQIPAVPCLTWFARAKIELPGRMPEWPNGADCKSVCRRFESGSGLSPFPPL